MEFPSVTFETTGDAHCESTCPHTPHVLQTCVILSLPVPSKPKFGYYTMQKTAAKETIISLAPWAFRSLDRRMSPVILKEYRLRILLVTVIKCFVNGIFAVGFGL